MKRSVLGSKFTHIVTGVLLTATIPLFGEDTDAAQQEPVIRVSLYNYARIPTGDLGLAKQIVARIFRHAGLEIAWSDVPVSGQAEAALRQTGRRLGAADLRVRILSESKVPAWAKKTHQVAFSLLPKSGAYGVTSSIYSERLFAIARRENHPTGLVLGCVIAHELGHLLLRMKGHGRSGIMSFPVTGQYLSRASRGRLVFTASQAKQLRRGLRKRWEYDRERSGSTGGLTKSVILTDGDD